MQPYAGTVGRAGFGRAAIPDGRDALAGAPSGAATCSHDGMLTVFRGPRDRAGFSIRTI
jgi:hypothetical protein